MKTKFTVIACLCFAIGEAQNTIPSTTVKGNLKVEGLKTRSGRGTPVGVDR